MLVILMYETLAIGYKLRFLGFKLEKYFGVFEDPEIRVMLVFLRYGSEV